MPATVVTSTSSVPMNSEPGAASRWAFVIARSEDEYEFAEMWMVERPGSDPTGRIDGVAIADRPTRVAKRRR